MDYFDLKLEGFNPEFNFSLAVNGVLVLMSVVALLYKFSWKLGVLVMFVFMTVCTLIVPIPASFITNTSVAFWITILILLLFGSATGIA